MMAAMVALAADDPIEVARLLEAEMDRQRASSWPLFRPWPAVENTLLLQAQWPLNPLLVGYSDYGKQYRSYLADRNVVVRDGKPPSWLHPWAFFPNLPGVMRMLEVGAAIGGGRPGAPAITPRRLVSSPTDVTGRLDAGVLLDRLQAAEDDGWQPLPLDLEQALLRLPRSVDPGLAGRAGALRSPAGARLAAWLAGGGPLDPLTSIVGNGPARAGTYRAADRPGGRRHAVLRLVEEPRSALHGALFAVNPVGRPGTEWVEPLQPVATETFPDHREVIAAWALTDLETVATGRHAELLPTGRHRGASAGPALILLLAYNFAADRAVARLAAVDALLSLSATGGLDAAALGAELGALTADGVILQSRVVPGLNDAARAGAGKAVWDVVAAMLPYVVGGRPAGLANLLALGVDLATTLGRRGSIPGLAALAARPGSGSAVVQARRLQQSLTGTG
jgi:hypothetical protein